MNTDKIKMKISNFREKLNEFADVLGDALGVNELVYVDPDEPREPETKTIHIILEREEPKKKKKTSSKLWASKLNMAKS